MSRSSDQTADMPERLGPYRLLQQIGTGGMGAVYRAYDERLHRPVALKRVRRSSKSSAKVAEEARAIAQLSHANIVQVYDLLSHDDGDWIVMELVEGLTLREILRQRRPEVDEVLRYALDIAKGLAAAHGRSLVHRDLKTENVMITSEGRAKILDFGLAMAVNAGQPADMKAGRIQGTPRAMSPEQAMGDPVDPRSDLFALGVLIYECLNGQSPFSRNAKGAYQILWRVCTASPEPLCDVEPSVPQGLSDLVDRLLEKTPERRPQSAEEVVVALQRLESVEPSMIRVLFVDDEPDFEPMINQWFNRRLPKKRYHVSFARNGLEALEALKADDSISLLFTDIRMPVMDGLELLGELSSLDRPCVSVVVSAFGDMQNIRTAMNLGAFDFVTKPFDFADLETTLDKAARQVAVVREHVRLRAENQLLAERNNVIRVAFSRYLQGDPELGQVFEPLVEQLQSQSDRHLTLLTLAVDSLAEAMARLSPEQFFDLARNFLNEVVTTVRLYRGEILRFETSQLSVGFSLLNAPETNSRRASACAQQLRRCVDDLSKSCKDRGGPGIGARLTIDAGDVTVDSQTGSVSGTVIDRIDGLMSQCDVDQILVTERARVLESQPATGGWHAATTWKD